MGEPINPPKTFTVEEAEALLPRLRPLLERIQHIQQDLLRISQPMEEVTRKLAAGNGYPIQSLTEELERLTKQQSQIEEQFQDAPDAIEQLGASLKDPNRGLIDFYGVRDGELIFLCWKLGEDRVRFWHALEDGYAGRQPL